MTDKKKPKRKLFIILAIVAAALFVTSDKGKEIIAKYTGNADVVATECTEEGCVPECLADDSNCGCAACTS